MQQHRTRRDEQTSIVHPPAGDLDAVETPVLSNGRKTRCATVEEEDDDDDVSDVDPCPVCGKDFPPETMTNQPSSCGERDGLISKDEMIAYFLRANPLLQCKMGPGFLHNFQEMNYLKPTFCEHCAGFMRMTSLSSRRSLQQVQLCTLSPSP